MTTAAALPSLGDLDAIVRTVAASPHLWRRHVRFDRGSRYWHRIATLPAADLWLLTWLPDQSTDLHDHGSSAAAFTVVAGALEEVRAHPDGRRARSTLSAGACTTVPPGAVNDVGNRCSPPAISIHAYAPRLEQMTFWESTPSGLRRLETLRTDEPEVA